MPSKHKRLQRQQAKAQTLKAYANPEEEDERGSGAAGDDEEEDEFLPQVMYLWDAVHGDGGAWRAPTINRFLLAN